MNNNREYAQRLKEMEGYERKIIAFKLCDTVPNTVEPYGMIFLSIVHSLPKSGKAANHFILPARMFSVEVLSIPAWFREH